MPNTHLRSSRILRHSAKIVGGLFVVLVAIATLWFPPGSAHGRTIAMGSQPSKAGAKLPAAVHATPSISSISTSPAAAPAPAPMVMRTAAVAITPTPTTTYVVSLIKRAFPRSAWHSAEVVAWCESKFHPLDIHYDSNGTHDRGLFQLNDGGTQQYLLQRLGFNPRNLNLAFNPVLNVRAAALLYARDGWSQWSCASAL